MTKINPRLSITCFSDVLCVWAYIAQVRLDEVAHNYPDQVEIRHRFCTVFGDTADKIGAGWRERGGYSGFGAHVLESAQPYAHVSIHPDIWKACRPASSIPAHLALKAVQRIDDTACERILKDIRLAFFRDVRDIAQASVLKDILSACGLPAGRVWEFIDNGIAHADLEGDRRAQNTLLVQGSPSYILNEGRQKLYGNVGYGVIDANIRELLRTPGAGAASWC